MAKIAIVKLSSLGDIIHALGALSLLSKAHEISWIVDSSFAGVLKNEPYIKCIDLPIRELKKSKSLSLLKESLKKLRALEEFDIVIDMQGLLKSALIAKVLKSKQLWGFDKNSAREPTSSFFYSHKVSISYDEHILERNCKLLREATNEDIRVENIKTPFLNTSSSQKKDAILIAFGSSKREKMYPKERILELVKMVQKEVFLLSYSLEEIEIAEFVVKNSDAKMLSKMSSDMLVNKISEFKFLVGVDSGVSYIGWALGLKTIMLFAPTNPKRFAPKDSNVDVIKADLMQEISPEEIVKRIV